MQCWFIKFLIRTSIKKKKQEKENKVLVFSELISLNMYPKQAFQCNMM